MIRRDTQPGLTLISQVDHAYLAGKIAACWGNDAAQVPSLPLADQLVRAVAHHDDGWHDWEAAPELDADSGRPLNFTEMPMDVATSIWSKSIDRCHRGIASVAEATSRTMAVLTRHSREFTAELAAVLECLLRQPNRFTLDEAIAACEMESVPRQRIAGDLEVLEEAGVLTSRQWKDGARLYGLAAELSRPGEAALPGIWVSRHFAWLAGQAQQHREKNEEQQVLARFLEQQEMLREQWTTDALRSAAGDDLERLIETGFRYVQFFDRLSLWLCCSAVPEPLEVRIPGGKSFGLQAQSSREKQPSANGTVEAADHAVESVAVSISPWPLSVPRLSLSAHAVRTRQQQFEDQQALQQAIEEAIPVALNWELVPALQPAKN